MMSMVDRTMGGMTGAALESPGVYTDLSGLKAISQLGRENTPEALKAVARQFESLFLNMMLKSMRESSASLFKDNYLHSNEMDFHQQNLDNQLSMHMASVGGIGLADALYRQMLGRYDSGALEQVAAERHPVQQRRIHERPAVKPADQQVTGAGFSSPQDFIAGLLPVAEALAPQLGIDPRVLLAQSALETGWGSAIAARPDGVSSHNLFGIKAGTQWQGGQVNVSTLEYRDGLVQRERASFRAYASYEESFQDYANLLRDNPRYARALEHGADARAFAEELQQAGYASDPLYAEKVGQVMRSPLMLEALQRAGWQESNRLVQQ